MIWLTWRQFRSRAIVAGVALTALAAYLVILGLTSRSDYLTQVVNCAESECAVTREAFAHTYLPQFTLLGILLLVVPALIGVFWGAPLVATELETRSGLLVWNQSITRTRWLAVKLAVVGSAAVATAGLFSLLLTWSASRYDQHLGLRFTEIVFGSRNIVPLGYALFAFVLGTVLGLVLRRTLAAMAVTLAVFTVLQVVVPLALRPHLMTPVTTTVAFDADAQERAHGFGVGPDGAKIMDYTMAGAWSLENEAAVVNADGSPVSREQIQGCMRADPEKDAGCLAAQNLHFAYEHHPGSRYWAFQWIEFSGYALLSLLVAALGLLHLRRRPS